MNIEPYISRDGNQFSVSRQQGSDFAKTLAGDFNPLHDADAKRFVVPGDLLFSLIAKEYGIASQITLHFAGMVNDTSPFSLAKQDDQIDVVVADKVMTSATFSGERHQQAGFIDQLISAYVAFSGQAYPHILVPVMRQAQVMINPSRPMVMYQTMSLSLDAFLPGLLTLEASEHEFKVDGKRGDMSLNFKVMVDGQVIGHGRKHMLLSGLRPFDEAQVAALSEQYDGAKQRYQTA